MIPQSDAMTIVAQLQHYKIEFTLQLQWGCETVRSLESALADAFQSALVFVTLGLGFYSAWKALDQNEGKPRNRLKSRGA